MDAVELFKQANVDVRNHMSLVSHEDIVKFDIVFRKSKNVENVAEEIYAMAEEQPLKEIEEADSFLDLLSENNSLCARVISPPVEDLKNLPTPLTGGELKVLEFFLTNLSSDWEVYIQPHLNGLRPDFILLHPERGIAVFEVKDWDLKKMNYHFKKGKLFATKNSKTFSVEKNNPFPRIKEYRDLIYNLFCPSLEGVKSFRVISEGVIFPNVLKKDLLELFESHYEKEMKWNSFNLVSSEDLNSLDIKNVFSNHDKNDPLMNDIVAQELRGWLVEPEFSKEQREVVILNSKQEDLVKSRTKSGFRRIKGAGGSGKTLVLAARAVNLAKDGKKVLLCTFNITLLNYLRDLCVRFIRDKGVLQNIELYHYHGWSKKVCLDTGFIKEYNELTNKLEPSVLVSEVLGKEDYHKYDAILVDEGQDYNLTWWNSLRLALVENGEMLLAVDPTQDVYEKAKAWTEDKMTGAGFIGNWVTLESSYRIPTDYIPLIKEFAETFIWDDEFRILPEVIQGELFDIKTNFKWIQVVDNSAIETCIDEIRAYNKSSDVSRSWADLVFLCDRKSDGKEVVDELESQNIRVIHTFYEDREDKRRKMAFYKGDARIKATTIHSFKGWEASNLIINISLSESATPALVYTALTRLKKSHKGATITVICSNDLYREYGEKWSSTPL